MALQTSIAQYFNSRKRRAVDEIKKVSESNKVLILDKNITDVSDINDTTSILGDGVGPSKKILLSESPKVVKPVRIVTSAPKLQRKTPKTTSSKKLTQKANSKQGDIRKSLLSSFNASLEKDKCSEEKADKKENHLPQPVEETVNVPFEIKGSISPRKTLKAARTHVEQYKTPEKKRHISFMTSAESSSQEDCVTPKKSSNAVPLEQADSQTSIKKTPVKNALTDLSSLKSKLLKSNRLDEIRNALNKINEGREKLKEIEAKIPPKSPSLKKFKSVEIEVSSPTKGSVRGEPSCMRPPESPSLLKRSLLLSPERKAGVGDGPRYVSPRKLFTETSPAKAPAHERLSALAAQGKPSLVLPFAYRSLAETFRAVDTVVSILSNRNETIHFSKLKASVQQLSKKNLTEAHLAKIHAVCPGLFSFRQEKLRHVPGQQDKYELVITPVFEANAETGESNKQTENHYMSPSILLERKRKIYKALLEKTKDYHQEFLMSLDPPMVLDKNKLTRWHPDFNVDGVPDITPHPLPQPPNLEKFSSAKDVLCKAREMFICNPRMEKALEKVSEESFASSGSAASAIPALTNALKGIPTSLLEKIRAKQAAKAAESLTRNPQTVKRKVELSRLPELARIIRNIFVGEKKNALLKSYLLKKLNDSFREVLTPSDLEHHLKLLMECSPGWLTMLDCRKEIFYKLTKETDLSKVLTDIQNCINKI